MIENTVMKVLSSKVSKLLEHVTDRLNTFPYKARTLSKWLKAILKHHSTLLITTP
jgi:hypothetical protein